MGKKSRREREKAPKKKRVQFVDRPFKGLDFEARLVAMREIVPAATLRVKLNEAHGGEDALIVSVLPGMASAARREDGVAMAAAQTVMNSGDASLDIADRLLAALELEAGETAAASELPDADGERLADVLDLSFEPEFTAYSNFAFWVSEDELAKPDVKAAVEETAGQMVPTVEVEGFEGAFWCRMQREFVRWVRPEAEAEMLDALARLQAKRELNFDGAVFKGAFRTSGMLIPVWELEAGTEAEELVGPLGEFAPKLEAALAEDTALTPEERRARNGIVSRQLTLR
ncbi:hypothetical protein J2S49_000863 [Arcanobacterium wilhelmae]|uniref:DUF5926 domain-containing protein n=1 Tax=Arcanobacterium wilhelmae TaxID=1803177 RepID=A0ABT9NAM7_9ACTO|nr:DUF5926 family protein [Arcanobacterium wilhelmae]MDP9800787.1 hypothetical protein [Arcanobacterium wilhelmae]WFN90164.1 DUF5926 family protein [Arcanobacterium wilhelmae]